MYYYEYTINKEGVRNVLLNYIVYVYIYAFPITQLLIVKIVIVVTQMP